MNKISGKTLVLVPAYNAAPYLSDLVNRVRKAAPNIDLLIINDGSLDNSAEVLEDLNVTFLSNDTNRGKGYSLRRGLDYAIDRGYEYVLTLDADLQHLPEEIPNFLNHPQKADLYIGTRTRHGSNMPAMRRLSNKLTSGIISFLSKNRISDSQSGYRMISTELLKRIKIDSDGYDFESEFLFKAGRLDIRIVEIPISTVYAGSSSYIDPVADTLRFIRLTLKRIFS
nr:glycosyltransferase family 2 protein [candidate division Zixibacteria bacterium]